MGVDSFQPLCYKGGIMQEKKYKLTKKGKKMLENLNKDQETDINMQDFAADLLGFKKDGK